MFGAIVGDVVGSVYEAYPIKSTTFPLFSRWSRFTDDTVLTVATADCLLNGTDYASTFHRYVARYPNAGYGATFYQWAMSGSTAPYNSWGNGAAMRVSPVAYAFDTMEEVLAQAEISAAVTHNHPEGIKGAQATALAIFLARQGNSKAVIRQVITARFAYDLDRTLAEIRPDYRFDVSCQGSVPESILCFLESEDYESAIRNAISLGGDADTMACIAGGIAEAFYGGVPASIVQRTLACLDNALIRVITTFIERYGGTRLSLA